MSSVYSKGLGFQVSFGVNGMAVHYPHRSAEKRTDSAVVVYTHQYDHGGNIVNTEQLIITPEAAEDLAKQLIVMAAKSRDERAELESRLQADERAANDALLAEVPESEAEKGVA